MRVRPATVDDAEGAATLLLELPGGLRELVSDRARAEVLARVVFSARRSVLSYRFALIAEDLGRVVGMVTRLPGRTWKRLRVPTGVAMARAVGLAEAPGIVTRGRIQDRLIPAVNADAFYVPALVVLPQRRGQGIGSMLLQRALEEAAELGLESVVLDVGSENRRAIGLYLRSGFHPVSEQRVEAARGLPAQGSIRMESPVAGRR
jgi:ribosomal protein S18 acetylase RimI-like enzyme